MRARRGGAAAPRREGHRGVRPCAAREQGARHVRRRRDRAGARGDRRRNRRARRQRRRLPDALVSVRSRRLVRAGRLGVRREPRARARGAPRRGAGCCAPARRRVPARRDDRRDRRRADGAAGARVGRASDRARPRLRERGVVRGHELPQGRRSRLASLRLGQDEHHRGLDDARRPRDVRLRRRRRPRAARADRRGGRVAQLLDVARDGRDARRRRGRLDARRRLEPHAADPDDEPPPRAGRRVVRRPARRASTTACTSRRTRAGRSTTSG